MCAFLLSSLNFFLNQLFQNTISVSNIKTGPDILSGLISHRIGWNREHVLANVDKKLLETEFLIAICRPTGDKWLSKTLFLATFDPRSSIVSDSKSY